MTLVTIDDNDIPRWLLGKLRSPFLGISIMSLSPSCLGFSLLLRILLAKLIIISLISYNLNTSGLMPPGPVSLFSLICFLTFSNSDLVKGPVLIFNSFSSAMVLIFSFSFIIFRGLPNSSLKYHISFLSSLFRPLKIALLVVFLPVISFINFQLSWCLLVLFHCSI